MEYLTKKGYTPDHKTFFDQYEEKERGEISGLFDRSIFFYFICVTAAILTVLEFVFLYKKELRDLKIFNR